MLTKSIKLRMIVKPWPRNGESVVGGRHAPLSVIVTLTASTSSQEETSTMPACTDAQ